MPRPPEGYSAFQKLVVPAAIGSACDLVSRYRNRMLDCCYNGYRGGRGAVGQLNRIKVPVVDENNVVDIGSGAIQLGELETRDVDIAVTNKESAARTIPSMAGFRSPTDLRNAHMDPLIEAVLRKSNRVLTSLLTPGNFPLYPTVRGGDTAFTRANLAEAWGNVAGTGGAPVNPAHTFFLTDHFVYGRMLGDVTQDWIEEYEVGADAAASTQQQAQLMPAFNARMDWDQMIPSSTPGKHGGCYFHRLAFGLLPVLEEDRPPGLSPVHQIVVFPTWDRNFPCTVQFWKDRDKDCWILHVFAMFGSLIVMPEYGSYMETT
jgi:hypothetical protein